MGNFNLDDYDPVDSRIHKFYGDHEDGAILTEMVSPIDVPIAVFKASILVGERTVATGYASEKAGEGFVNKTSHLENAETSAIGRGLANFGYSGNKRPSREEMEKVQRAEEPPDAAVMMKGELRKQIDDRKLEGVLTQEQHEHALEWLDGFALTVQGMTAAKKKLAERFNDGTDA